MPVSAEQWRASVGCNNAARWHGRGKSQERMESEEHNSLNFQALLITSCECGNSHSHGHAHKRMVRGLLCLVCLITVATCLLLCSGDVETNPGPITLTTKDLAKVRRLTFDACDKWHSFGLELGLRVTTLDIIRQTYNRSEDQFTEMLSKWLRMTDPPPTWETLIAALKERTMGLHDVAERVKKESEKLATANNTATPDSSEQLNQENGGASAKQAMENEAEQVVTEPHDRSDVTNTESPSKVVIKHDIEILEREFGVLVDSAFNKVRDVKLDIFKSRLVNLPIKHKHLHKDFFQKFEAEITSGDLNKMWFTLNGYWDYLNYSLLEHIISKFGDCELQRQFQDYKKKLTEFHHRTRLRDFVGEYCEILPDQKLFALKLDERWDDCTLEDLEMLKANITQKFFLPSFVLQLQEIRPGCINITWAVPHLIASALKETLENTDTKEFYKTHGILSIRIDGQECKYSAVRCYSAYLKDLYSQKPDKNLVPFKLAGIAKEKVERSKFDKFTLSTLRGDPDDVVYSKHHIEEDRVGCPTWFTDRKQPRLILIEGAPGVGKTTFSQHFCYNWSQGQRLSKHKLLILLPLRDNRVKSAKNVSDLFPHPQLQQAIAEEVEGSGGEGVALWLEAWDELEEDMREKFSLFLQLVHGQVLPKSTVIITSRPWATENIRKSSNVKIDQHIEIVSTSSIQLRQVLKEMVKPDSSAKFLDYLDDRPVMKAAMHTPVTANIVADVFQWCRDTESPLPTTMTELYTALTCKLLMEHLFSHKVDTDKSQKIRSLDEVPKDTKKQLLNLCGLSWQGLVKQQLTFSSDDVGGDTLGLMRAVKELYGGKDGQLSYHFIHLTLQEFLSAYHITQFPLDKQEQIIREHVDTGHLTMTMKFIFGLTKRNPPTSLISDHISSQHESKSSNVFHWLFETGGRPDESVRSVGVKSSFSWSPLDYYVLGHTISRCDLSWELQCMYTSMGDEGMEMLCRGMSASTDNTCAGKITRADIIGNDITFDGIKWLDSIPLQILQQIRHLNLGINRLDRNGLTAFSQVIPKLTMLRVLSLNRNPITNGDGIEVLRSLHQYKTPLETLDLRDTGISEQESMPLVQLIGDNVLKTICISGDLLPSIMKCPLPNSTLQTLSMLNTPLSEEAIVSLSSLLQQSVLQFMKLNIQFCDVTSDGAVQLARALTNNSWLTELDMSDNSIGEEGAKAFGKMLKENRTLKKLDLLGDDTLGEGVYMLTSSLQENNTLQKLVISYLEYRPRSDPRVEWC